jgi:hypothetical protein
MTKSIFSTGYFANYFFNRNNEYHIKKDCLGICCYFSGVMPRGNILDELPNKV